MSRDEHWKELKTQSSVNLFQTEFEYIAHKLDLSVNELQEILMGQ